MGGTSWSTSHYTDRVQSVAASGGPTFKHDADVRTGVVKNAIHESLDPKLFKGGIRESRDSDAHPNSTPIVVAFDVTGSMASVPKKLQTVLPRLMGLLLRKGYIVDPQVLMASIGDYNGSNMRGGSYSWSHQNPDGTFSGLGDKAPCQIGQFESGIEMDIDLTNMFLEGRGGGQTPPQESYQLIWYFASRKAQSDAWEKRTKKGYLFTIGDESPYDRTPKEEIFNVFGDSIQEADIPTDRLLMEVKDRWEVFHIIPTTTNHGNDPRIHAAWSSLLGPEFVIRIDNVNTICEVIGSTIGLMEGTTTQEDLGQDLRDVGTDAAAADNVVRSMDSVARSAATRRGISTGPTERL